MQSQHEVLNPEVRYMTLKNAARYLSLSEKTLYKWATSKCIPAHKVGRIWLFDRRELDVFVHGSPSTVAGIMTPAVGFELKEA
jgi:excisionase family DNA binding protein